MAAAFGPRQLPGWQFRQPATGAGIGTDFAEATLAAVGEVLERYCSVAPPPAERVVRARFRDVGDHAVAPGEFSLLSGSQYARSATLEPLTDDKCIEWVWAYSLSHRRARLIPAGLTYFAKSTAWPNNFLPELSTTGLSCHMTTHDAVLGGIYEVVERDALAVAWFNGLRPRVIVDVNRDLRDLLEGPLACDWNFSLYALPSECNLPVICALARGERWPYAVLGVACRSTMSEAAAKALLEACQGLHGMSQSSPRARPSTVRTFEDHAHFYATEVGAALLEGQLTGGAPIQLDRKPSPTGEPMTVDMAVKALSEINLEVLVVDVTTADVAATGSRVVRVVIPGAVDVNADARYPRLGGVRLWDVPVRLGLASHRLAEQRINPLPIPLG